MKKIVFATKNQGKLKEIREILGDKYNIVSMEEAGINIDVEENGTTFEENAILKAEAVMKICNEMVLADDSGLEVDYLNKEPGIYSSRYMGEDTPYSIKNQAIIDKLQGVEDEKRTARFVCAVACAIPDKYTLIAKETMEGIIAHEIIGENGFGYDPIFYLPEYKKTSAQLTMDEKNKISHRGKALRAMAKRIKKLPG